MLNHLQIRNFALIDILALDIQPNLTVITGETGAGKSIIIDALSLCLGARADYKQIHPQATQSEISAEFDISANTAAKQWLEAHDYEPASTCILIRILTKPNRSRCLINGRPCPLQHHQALGKHLVDISSQHQHLTLLDTNQQRQLVDRYANHLDLTKQLNQTYQQWAELQQKIDHWHSLCQDQTDKLALIEYHLAELDELALQENEITDLHQQFQQQHHASDTLQACQTSLHLLDGLEQSTTATLQSAVSTLQLQQQYHPNIQSAVALLDQAQIHLSEACQELTHSVNEIQLDPAELQQLEQRINAIHTLARKHRVEPEALLDKASTLKAQQAELHQAADKLQALKQQQNSLAENYQALAKQLHDQRKIAAQTLSEAVTQQLPTLGLEHGKFDIRILPTASTTPTPYGLDHIEFWVSTNLGHPPGPLAKVASGGELSRISLIFSVLCGQHQTNTQIFDEVDVGISGSTAEVVGQLLKTLAQHRQILCITHLPQVAAQGHHHLKVIKTTENNQTKISITSLTRPQHIKEIARLLGGIEISAATLAHAEAMCSD